MSFSIPSYIFGGENTDVRTPDDLARKRALVDAMMQQQIGSQTPRNLGEGLGAIGKALMVRQARQGLQSANASVQAGQDAYSPIVRAAMMMGQQQTPPAPQIAQTAIPNQQPDQSQPPISSPISSPRPYDGLGPDMTHAQPVPAPTNPNLPPALSSGQQVSSQPIDPAPMQAQPQLPIQAQPQVPQGAASGQLAALMDAVNRPEFAFLQRNNPAYAKMMTDQIQTIQAQNNPLAKAQLAEANLNIGKSTVELQNLQHPENIQMTPKERAMMQVYGVKSEYMLDPTDPSGQRVVWRPGGKADPETIARNANAKSAQNTDTYKSTVASLADGVQKGDIPMSFSALGRYRGDVNAELGKRGFDVAKATLNYGAEAKHLAGMNSGKQIAMRQGLSNVKLSLDKVDQLNAEWNAGGYPLLNQANRLLAENGGLGPDANSIIRQLDAEIADVTSNMGSVYMGGGSPTDHGLELAAHNLGADWGEKVLGDMTKLARFNIQAREDSLNQATQGVDGALPNSAGTSTNTPPAAAAPSTQKILTFNPKTGRIE